MAAIQVGRGRAHDPAGRFGDLAQRAQRPLVIRRAGASLHGERDRWTRRTGRQRDSQADDPFVLPYGVVTLPDPHGIAVEIRRLARRQPPRLGHLTGGSHVVRQQQSPGSGPVRAPASGVVAGSTRVVVGEHAVQKHDVGAGQHSQARRHPGTRRKICNKGCKTTQAFVLASGDWRGALKPLRRRIAQAEPNREAGHDEGRQQPMGRGLRQTGTTAQVGQARRRAGGLKQRVQNQGLLDRRGQSSIVF
jgi:hypothetical protein